MLLEHAREREFTQPVADHVFGDKHRVEYLAVVDAECKVKGIGRLRVCDASILPLPIASHYQAAMYAIAEATAANVRLCQARLDEWNLEKGRSGTPLLLLELAPRS